MLQSLGVLVLSACVQWLTVGGLGACARAIFPPLSCAKCPIRVICCRAILHRAARGSLEDDGRLIFPVCHAVHYYRCSSALRICSTLPESCQPHDSADLPAHPMVIETNGILLCAALQMYGLMAQRPLRGALSKMLWQGARQQSGVDTLQAHVVDVLVSLVHNLLRSSCQCEHCFGETHATCSLPCRVDLTAQQRAVEGRPAVWQGLSFANRVHDCLPAAASDLLQELLNHILGCDDAQWLALRHARKVGLLRGNTGRGLQWVLAAFSGTALLARP